MPKAAITADLTAALKTNKDWLAGKCIDAISDLGLGLWRDGVSYEEALTATTVLYGELAGLVTQLAFMDSQVANGGWQQYFDNGYASNGGGCFQSHDPDCPLHHKLVRLFETHKLFDVTYGALVLDIMKRFAIIEDEGETVDELRGPEVYYIVDNEDDLSEQYYSIREEFIAALDDYLKGLLDSK